MNIAIILAGGAGSRMGNETPKQFLKIAGKTVIEYAIDVFEKNTLIDEIAVVVHESYITEIESLVVKNGWQKVKKILKGGRERSASALAAINAYQQFPTYNLLFHDAVRPLVSNRIIYDIIKALEQYNAVTVAIPSTDTMYQVDHSHNFVKNITDRSFIHRAQTPQGFKVETIQKAYKIALKDPDFQSTDDAGVVAKYLPDEKVYLVRGEESNVKLTYKEDMWLIEQLLLPCTQR